MKKEQILYDRAFDVNYLNKYATLMSLGNGYLGLRAAHEEDYTEQTRGMYVAGIYNKAAENETSELVNLPDLIGMKIEIDGEPFSLLGGEILSYDRQLNLSNGEIKREILWKNKQGDRYQFRFQRFVAKNHLHVLALKLTVISLDRAVKLKITTGIDAQQTNFGNQHLSVENVRVFDEEIMQGIYKTKESGHTIALTTSCSCSLNSDISFAAKNRKLLTQIKHDLSANQPFTLEKMGTIYTSLDQMADGMTPETIGLDALHESRTLGFDTLLKQSASEWTKFWNENRVRLISKNDFDQFALDYALFQIEVMTPAHDERCSVGAKGLSGEGYKGHVFWDTEIFILPFHLYTKPDTAKKLLSYRHLHLQQALDKAQQNGYEGALYPWESAFTGKEETPEFAAINIRTGKRQKVASAIAEHHIVADIAFAVVQYYTATYDEAFMKKEGLKLLKETCRFWISRSTDEDGLLSIKDVIGPDEYTEHIDNNAYTNYMAYFNVEQALVYMKKYEDADSALILKCEDFLQRLYLPKPSLDKIIPQDDTFLSKPEIDLTPYKEHQGSQGILLDYSRAEVNEMQILKQADIVMLLYLFPDMFSSDVVARNLHYYEKHTIHDSSLSKAIHAIVAARCQENATAYRFFQEACLIDLGPNPRSSDEGLHAASLGAIWLATIFGFANVSVTNNQLSMNPSLPTEWSELAFQLQWQGTRIDITIKSHQVVIINLSGPTIQIHIQGKQYVCLDRIEVDLSKE